ncbi:hypothetical protein HK096_001267 [Nowakowskiella sp. JEL0078]|nr:hypothetical protein HK096_001267 [Nowakowskiella sp. JEL0078]
MERFLEIFDDDDILYDDKREAFKDAIESHQTILEQISNGYSTDKHIFGLNSVASKDEKLDPFFTTADIIGPEWKISTKNMSPGLYFYSGFGAPSKDGYGVSYSISEHTINFSISGRKHNGRNNIYNFRDGILQGLKDVMILFPKRTAIWGHDWTEKRRLELKEKAFMGKLSEISSQYQERKEILRKKYQ